MKTKKNLLLILVIVLAGCSPAKESSWQSDLKLWYDEPAEIWEEALPVGNGTLGAMVFGHPVSERIQFNEDTFWAGGPINPSNPETKKQLPKARELVFAGQYKEAHDHINKHLIGPAQMPYLPMGDLHIALDGIGAVTDYRRSLDLKTAIAEVSYTAAGVNYRREVFSTPVDKAIVIHMEASKKEALNFTLSFKNEIGARSGALDSKHLILSGKAPDKKGRTSELQFHTILNVLENDGSSSVNDSTIQVRGASNVTLLLFAATNFINYKDVSGDASHKCNSTLALIGQDNYEIIKEDHIREHQRLFNRLEFNLESTGTSDLPTDERLSLFQEEVDPSLVALHYQYGRYLLISSSSHHSQPANLQGLWNHQPNPPWDSKYTCNINFEMNYWPAEVSNLAECTVPLFTAIRELSEAGSMTAKNNWGVNGWVVHHNTDIWRTTTPLDGASWGIWPTGGAWLSTHLWEHYLFSEDEAFLKLHYPVMRESARFFVESLVRHPDNNFLVTCPSISPENRHMEGNISVCAGPAMDTQLIRDLFDYCIKAAEILSVDKEFSDTLRHTLTQLPPDKIGAEGQLQEWLDDWDMKVPDIQHRHVSHLYGLYPGARFTREETPGLWNAARKSLEIRGDGGTGWSLGWKISLWARLLDGEHAFKILKTLLKPTRYVGHGGPGGTYPNLFDACPPFQIDGNFGAVAGINEMLLQSQNGKIELLPALPKALRKGKIRGIRARGGFELAMLWEDGKLKVIKILSKRGNTCHLVYGDKTLKLETVAGKSYLLNGNLEPHPKG